MTISPSEPLPDEDYKTWVKRILKLPRHPLPGEDAIDWRERNYVYRLHAQTGAADRRNREGQRERQQEEHAKRIAALVNGRREVKP
jgi:hypothetical protein